LEKQPPIAIEDWSWIGSPLFRRQGAAPARRGEDIATESKACTPLTPNYAPPLPPFQDARDPKYARLVAMTQQIDDSQKAALEQERRKHSEFVGKTLHPLGGSTPPPQPQPQQVQRWCTVSGQGVTGRVPC